MKDGILILGAGPAGMACAMELHRAGRGFTLVEKNDRVGGLAKTYRFGEFLTDNGPHRFFSRNRYLYDLIEDLLGEEWIRVERFTRFYIGGKYYRYPIAWRDALRQLGPVEALRVLADYTRQRSRRGRPPRNFEEYAVRAFGRALAEFNILNYTEKIWGLPCDQLSAEWAQQRIRGLTLRSLLRNALFGLQGPKTLVDEFYYPSLGTGRIYEAIHRRVAAANRVLLSQEPVRVACAGGRIRRVVLASGETLEPEEVVSSVPITRFLEILDPAPPRAVQRAAGKLRFRSQVYLFITLDKPSVSPDQWIYFPDPEIPFGRISEMRNFSSRMSPEGKTSLFVEFFCWEGDEVWRASRDELLAQALEWLERLDLVAASEVIEAHHLRKRHVYPVYTLDYSGDLALAKGFLDGFENLQYIGRPGRFRYTNQDHSLEMGILAAKGLIEGRRFDLEAVGSDDSYLEGGDSPGDPKLVARSLAGARSSSETSR